MDHPHDLLRRKGIQPSAQRVAIARHVLQATSHPTADEVLGAVRRRLPEVSRATVYNTLNLFVAKGLLRALQLDEGPTRFDPRTDRHHHFVDEETGAVTDVDGDALEVRGIGRLEGFDVRDFQVVMRGRATPTKR